MSENRSHGGEGGHREWHASFMEQKVLVNDHLPDDLAVTICDGKKHRTVRTGAYDTLERIVDCDGNHEDYREGTGRDVQKKVPNLDEYWFTREENYDREGPQQKSA